MYLRGNNNLVSVGEVLQSASEDLLAVAERIAVGRVEEIDPRFERLLDEGAAFFLAKQLSSYYLTVAWAAEGFFCLVLGMMLNALELRYPSLLLLGACVFKALMIDTSQLPLPQRVGTFVALGIALIVASMLYVQLGKNDAQGPPTNPA